MTDPTISSILKLACRKNDLTTEETVTLLRLVKKHSEAQWLKQGHPPEITRAIHTKFNDAGRRSAPWRAFSKKMPGRPQDGGDGNRINRWLLPVDHKFYATEKIATLVFRPT
jgi:hypothetical protein